MGNFIQSECGKIWSRKTPNTHTLCDSCSLKLAINTAFDEHSVSVKIPEERYFKSTISSNADGASLNFRMNRANLAQLEKSRPRLITIHCNKIIFDE